MAKQPINLGTAPTGAGGDTPRSAFTKSESNFTELYSFLGAAGSPASLPGALPLAAGGTGGTTAAAARSNLGLGSSSSPVFSSIELSAAIPYIDFHYGNSAADFTSRLAGVPGGLELIGGLQVSQTVDVSGILSSAGTRCRRGTAGPGGNGNSYNFDWTTGGNIDAYIATVYVGTLTLFTSDYRIKKYIKSAEVPSYLDRIDAYRIVNFQKKNFAGVFTGDGTTYQGLIAHEVKEVNPLAVIGEKDRVNENGDPMVQQLEPIALITDLMGAVKELRQELNALKASLEPAVT